MTKSNLDYKKLNQELETILESLQSGSLTIDEAIKKYERGQKLITQLQQYLDNAENVIKKVTKQ